MKIRAVGCNDDEIMKFRILRGGSKVKSKTTLDFRTGDCTLFREVGIGIGKIPQDTTLDSRRAQQSWVIFKNHFFQAQERSIAMCRKSKAAGRLHGLARSSQTKLKT